MRINGFLKNQKKSAANVGFNNDVIDFVLKIKANAVIGDNGDGKQAAPVSLTPSVSSNVPVTTYVPQLV